MSYTNGDYDTAAVARVLRQVRLDAHLTQERLAQECGLHPTYISLLERGRSVPSLRAVWLIAKCVDLHPSALVARIEQESAAARLPESHPTALLERSPLGERGPTNGPQ